VRDHEASPLADQLAAVLARASQDPDHPGLERALATVARIEPADPDDGARALIAVHRLFVAPLEELGGAAAFGHHPAIGALKRRLEAALVARLEDQVARRLGPRPVEPVAAIRRLAATDLVPPLYDWVATTADLGSLRRFLVLEGGPDGGFDDLVAACQVGLAGEPKLELARNYWDEMGRGDLAEVHTELHRRLSAALGLEPLPLADQGLAALDRGLLGSLLATNRHLQPEMVGALGLIELQAGPRCRRVVQGLRRLGAGPDALAFYVEHADADPRHGKAWLDHVIAPLADRPGWGPGMVRGAQWRSAANGAFLDDVTAELVAERAHVGSPVA